MNDLYCWAAIVALGLVACWGVSHFRDLANLADERRGRTVEIIAAMIDVTAGQEPTRLDANDPLRDRFVFCERWTDHGHAPECPWVAAMNRLDPSRAALEASRER